jgi:hypothetical protein
MISVRSLRSISTVCSPRGVSSLSLPHSCKLANTFPSSLCLTLRSVRQQQKYGMNTYRFKMTQRSNASPKDSVGMSQAVEKESTFLQRYMAHKEMPPRNTAKWYFEMVLLCTVFAITGTSTMIVVRPAVSEILGLKGSLKDGPWSYRLCSLIIMTPLYAINLVLVGTIFGRHFYFRHFAVKMFSRFGIPPELMDKNFHQTAKHFRKW